MSIKDKVTTKVRNSMEARSDSDGLDDILLRAQQIIDSTAKEEIRYIERLSETYSGRKTLIETYTPRWFNESLFSEEVLSNIIENLMRAVSTPESFVSIPKFWRDKYNGNNTIYKDNLPEQAERALTLLNSEIREEIPEEKAA